jgi:hypothetical protein
MFFAHWLRRRPQPLSSYRPTVQQLEDRTVPTVFPPMAPATHLQVIIPATSVSGHQTGQAFDVWVQALDAYNRLATGYRGTINLRSSDPTATGSASPFGALTALPLNYTFTGGDLGFHVFHVNLRTPGSQFIAAVDTRTPSIGGSANTSIFAPSVATTLVVQVPSTAATGVATRVVVDVLDQTGHRMLNFTGAVIVTSATGAVNHTVPASLPLTWNFTAGDQGEHAFYITFTESAAATGTATTVTATTARPTLTGSAALTVYPPTVVTHQNVISPPLVFPGVPVPAVVQSLNASNQVVSTTVQFIPSVPGPVTPANNTPATVVTHQTVVSPPLVQPGPAPVVVQPQNPSNQVVSNLVQPALCVNGPVAPANDALAHAEQLQQDQQDLQDHLNSIWQNEQDLQDHLNSIWQNQQDLQDHLNDIWDHQQQLNDYIDSLWQND